MKIEYGINNKCERLLCPVCRGTGLFDYKNMEKTTIYGLSLDRIRKALIFCEENGLNLYEVDK